MHVMVVLVLVDVHLLVKATVMAVVWDLDVNHYAVVMEEMHVKQTAE